MAKSKAPPHKVLQKEKNNQSVISLKNALLFAIENPNKANEKLINSCLSQGKLAALNIENLNISPMSLNAFKNSCERIFEGGFKEIDFLRLRARSAYEQHLSKSHIAKAGTKSYYIQEIEQLKYENQKLVDSSVFLASKYYELLHLFQRMVKRATDGKFVPNNEARLLEQHIEKFDYKRFGKLKIYDGGKL